jgi:hypothetical protein
MWNKNKKGFDKAMNVVRYLPRAGVALPVPTWATTAPRSKKEHGGVRARSGWPWINCFVLLLAATSPHARNRF